MKRLRKHWNIQSNWQLFVILLVFSLTGSSSAYLAEPALTYIGLERDDFSEGFWFGGLGYYLLYFVFIFPIYLLLLAGFGWLFGMFSFFWKFEKKMLKRLGLAFLFRGRNKKKEFLSGADGTSGARRNTD